MKTTLARGIVAAALAGAATTATAAVSFLFDPTGTSALGTPSGFAVTATTMDQAPGNALAIGAIPAFLGCLGAGGSNCTNQVQLTYQANLAQFTNSGTGVFDQGDIVDGLARNFTYSLSFPELLYGATSVAGINIALLQAGGSGPNFFRMYASGGVIGNDLTGANFATGALILQGTVTTADTSTTSFASRISNLDPFGTNDWPGVTTVENIGTTKISVNITAIDNRYFPDLQVGGLFSVSLEANTSQVLPFDQANPSCSMINPTTGAAQGYNIGTFAGGACGGPWTIGATNGLVGPDFLFQADANSSFEKTPEPGTLALLAGGLIAAGFWRRRVTK